MKRSRRWEFVKQDVLRLAALGLSADEIANRLELGRATVFRWKKAGKLRVETPSPSGQKKVVTVTQGETPAQWVASVRAAYDLSTTDEQLVSQGETALLVARDPNASASLRFQAMREFRATVKQLALVARREPADKPEEPPKRQTFEVQRRSGGDPRSILSVAK